MVFQIIFAIQVLLISIYSLTTENFNLQPLMLIFMSTMLPIVGLRENKRAQSIWSGIIYLYCSLFILFVGVQGIMIK
ncbi:DUF3953 domain-containing protein [Lysinibacillus sp. NPDC096418]|uniref:DUF3953 domain-containing protein n=1 Tax=Lysinibacillus sp. NPDC096418 TaxID=3364138 RepID=UPI00382B91E9